MCLYACARKKKIRANERASEIGGGGRAMARERKRTDGADITAARGRKRRSTTGRTRDNEPASHCSPRASERSESGNAACAPVCHPRGTVAGIYPADLSLLMDSFSPSRGQPSRESDTWNERTQKKMLILEFFFLNYSISGHHNFAHK